MPSRRTTPAAYERASRLRKEPTPAEAKLWEHLRGNKLAGISFRRQHAIGRYTVDFCSPRSKLAIELDGGQHREREVQDALRTEFLESRGYRVLRFWNHDVIHDVDGVLRAIQSALSERRAGLGP